MPVETATGTGMTRTAAALLKRLFETNWETPAPFLVDRNMLAVQTEGAVFVANLLHPPSYRALRAAFRMKSASPS